MSEHQHSHHAGPDTSTDDIAQCPVMPGSTIAKAEAEEDGLVRDHNGTRYCFHCAGCLPTWDAHSARYANA
ncbi:hypothetical protein I4I84_00755 [Pseudonocardia sp. KRD-182]|uniref:hypothetical protein n=1 Tax=Pseudonocardia oceani TaxID=2792013 RepID=UPI001C5C5E74|nr:hypothetical protein [Pseudonocardia oceani]MBW0107281.1 hypothetical protein [Pseudonocardia oceani]